MTGDLFEDRGATFSSCRKYRYKLWRTWDRLKTSALFLMLNPSTADEQANDPTVERCERRARDMGWGGLIVANIFALRATDPKVMLAAADPIGPENDEWIKRCVYEAGIVICGWGAHGSHRGRDKEVFRLIHDTSFAVPHHLGLTKAGQPRHPLYIGYDVKPMQFEVRA